jgi:hypothetical protein
MEKDNVENTNDKTIVEDDFSVGADDIKPYDPVRESLKHQITFDKVSTALGKLIIISYIFVILSAFLLYILNVCDNCYPDFMKQFETLVLIIIGFFFGTRLIYQYVPFDKH